MRSMAYSGRKGRSPSDFLRTGGIELSAYKSVCLRRTGSAILGVGGEFEFGCGDGTSGIASKILLATGLVDEVTRQAGVESLYGVSVHMPLLRRI